MKAADYLATTKPRVVLLFLATSSVGMVLAGGWPPLSLTTATLLGVALTVGGAAALNEYLERDIDRLMPRTAGRPLPAGRLAPGAVRSFGLGLCALGVVELGFLVNPLSALLGAAGAFYYVVVYTLLLKPRSPQSAIPGGLAGVFPPLIGWAATSRPWTMATAYLCALIFLWSPPHFWSLTLARAHEFSRAGIPTMPATRGEDPTRLEILTYVLAVVGVSLLPVVAGLLGSLYLALATAAAVALVVQLVRVLQSADPRQAFILHKLTGFYLAIVLAGMVADRLL